MSFITLMYMIALPVLSKRYSPKWRYRICLAIGIGWLIPFRPFIELPILPLKCSQSQLILTQSPLSYPLIDSPLPVISSGNRELLNNASSFSIWKLVFLIWIIGIFTMLTYHLLRHRHFLKMVTRWSETVDSPEIITLLNSLKKEQQIDKNISYKICSVIASPMMIGYFHPVILMPPLKLSDKELTLILRHELIHYKRKDIWSKTMLLAATILHWYNPVVYLMAKAASLQCEISCDALVLQQENKHTRIQYGETILSVIPCVNSQQTILSTNFYGGKKEMKQRILSMLDDTKKRSGIFLFILAALSIMLTSTTLISSAEQLTYIENTAFTKEEYDKLLALRFDGYQDMSIADFKQAVSSTVDTPEYMELLERFYNDEQLNGMKDTNEIAAFLFYELLPLTTEKWDTRYYFFNSFTIRVENADPAYFEYTLSLSIKNDQQSVKTYSNTRKAIMEEMNAFIENQPESNLHDRWSVSNALQPIISDLFDRFQNNDLEIQLGYCFVPRGEYDDNKLTYQ